MTNFKELSKSVDEAVAILLDLRKKINREMNNKANKKTEPTEALTETTESIPSEDLEGFSALKRALESDKWPEAVNPNLICHPDNEGEKLERGRGIIELMIEEDLKDLKFLDFGCGEGQCAFAAASYSPKQVVGYDSKEQYSWNKQVHEKLQYTTDFEVVKENGPYDVITIFDVIDHIKNEDPSEFLRKAKSVLADKGKIYMRCHPFVSRHGTHLYHELNKAYVHLVFTEDELNSLVPDSKWKEDSIKIIYPIKQYLEIIEKSGLKIIDRREVKENVEPFFKIPKIAERIMKNLNVNSFPEYQMSIQFIDLKLAH